MVKDIFVVLTTTFSFLKIPYQAHPPVGKLLTTLWLRCGYQTVVKAVVNIFKVVVKA